MSLLDDIKKEEEELEKSELQNNQNNESEDADADDNPDTTESNDNESEGDNDNSSESENKSEDNNKESLEDDSDKDDSDKDSDDKKFDENINKNDLFSKLRIERKKRQKLEEEINNIKNMMASKAQGQTSVFDENSETKNKDDISLEERVRIIEQNAHQSDLRSRAIDEFTSLENDFKKDNPDYEDVSKFFINRVYSSLMTMNPDLNTQTAQRLVQDHILSVASNAVNRGLNPVEHIYEMAFDKFGYKKPEDKSNGGEVKVDKIKNLKTASDNKKRSASPLKGGTTSNGISKTLQDGINMSVSDFSKLSDSEIDNMLSTG